MSVRPGAPPSTAINVSVIYHPTDDSDQFTTLRVVVADETEYDRFVRWVVSHVNGLDPGSQAPAPGFKGTHFLLCWDPRIRLVKRSG